MPSITDQFKEEIRSRNDIVDVIGEYIPLKPKGRKHIGVCPFHNDHSPSLNVDADKQLYYCFSCHAAGDVIRFVENYHNRSFFEAIEFLANRCGLSMPTREESAHEKRMSDKRSRIYDVLGLAANYYHERLKTNPTAVSYLKNRGLGDAIIKKYGIGFALDGWTNTAEALKAMNVTEQELLDSGLCNRKEDRLYDMFRARIMIPIINKDGKVIAFGGRIIGEGQPKYLNSADTLVFQKKRNLFGINYVKKQRNQDVLLVEGYMDVISLAAHGVNNAVATLGTALTSEQARLIKSISSNVYLAYDGDSAGINAALRGVDILMAEGCAVRVIRFPDGKDPDEFIRSQGLGTFNECKENALLPMDFKLELVKEKYNLSNPDDRTKAAQEALEAVSLLESAIEREAYISKIHLFTGFSTDALGQQMGVLMKNKPRAQRAAARNRNNIGKFRDTIQYPADTASVQVHEVAQRRLLAVMMNGYAEMVTDEEYFIDPLYKKVFLTIKEIERAGASLSAGAVLDRLHEDEERKAAEVFFEMQEFGDVTQYIGECVKNIRLYKIESEINELQMTIGGASDQTRILERLNELNRRYAEVKNTKE